MSEKTKKVQLIRPMTWRGTNYAPGLNEMPAAAADYAVRRNFGKASNDGEPPQEGEAGEGFKTETITEEVVGLPEDFPMRHVFEKLGFKSVADVQAKSREELIALNGIAETTADKALAFGK